MSSQVSSGKSFNFPKRNSEDEPHHREHVHSEDTGFFLSAVNLHSKKWFTVIPIRFLFLLLLYLVALAISFGGFDRDEIWAVAIGAVVAPVFTRLCLYISRHFIFTKFQEKKNMKQLPMVTWMSFGLFMDCVYYFFLPKEGGDARNDHELQKLADIYDESTDPIYDIEGRFIFDFVADTGDGFDPTYSVASVLALKELHLTNGQSLHRASVVIHGGDICYPFPNFKNFYYRFIRPYSLAFPWARHQGEKMYFATGNHEYMDGLVGMRKFLLSRDWIGGWITPQKGSYFALKLPRGWWMFVVDLGPEPEDIDEVQQRFFDSIEIADDEKIILVYHVPDWIKCGNMGYSFMKRLRLWRKSLGNTVRLVLAGDLHYYRRMELDDGSIQIWSGEDTADVHTDKQTFIVAGHGGAFGHSTAFPMVDKSELKDEDGKFLNKKSEYPTCQQWQSIWKSKWFFMFVNTTNHIYSRVLGAVYMFLFMAILPTDYRGISPSDLLLAASRTLFFYLGLGWLIITHTIMVVANFSVETAQAKLLALLLVCIHTGLHLSMAFGTRFGLDRLFMYIFEAYVNPLVQENEDESFHFPMLVVYCIVLNLMMYLVGTFISPFITACYFSMSIKYFDWHYNEAISMIQHPDNKGFCRFAILPNGDIEIYCIVIDKSPTEWNDQEVVDDENDPCMLKSSELEYRLFEKVTLSKFPGQNLSTS